MRIYIYIYIYLVFTFKFFFVVALCASFHYHFFHVAIFSLLVSRAFYICVDSILLCFLLFLQCQSKHNLFLWFFKNINMNICSISTLLSSFEFFLQALFYCVVFFRLSFIVYIYIIYYLLFHVGIQVFWIYVVVSK